MPSVLSDTTIESLIREPKVIPTGLVPLGRMIERNKSWRKELAARSASDSGNEFVLVLRQAVLDAHDFSAILGYKMPGSNTIFRLCRYNGSHFHTNTIERISFNDFHVHRATERYQLRGSKEDAFAIVTSRHSNFESAIQCLLEDCGFNAPGPQLNLFGKV